MESALALLVSIYLALFLAVLGILQHVIKLRKQKKKRVFKVHPEICGTKEDVLKVLKDKKLKDKKLLIHLN